MKMANLPVQSLIKLLGAALCLGALTGGLQAQYVTTPAQKATAEQVAQTGVALSELAPNAPDNYTVKAGDTLWAISGLFLKSPWRWPELWGMNLQEIRNPHRIYPGQQLFLDKSSGRAVLRTTKTNDETPPSDTVKVTPRTRYGTLADASLPTLAPTLIEPFLAEPIIVDEKTLLTAPRIVASQEGRIMLTRGDRGYARSDKGDGLMLTKGSETLYRIFRNATPLKDPGTGKVLGYEAQYVGTAELVRSEGTQDSTGKDGKTVTDIVPATIDIVNSKEEIKTNDRLLPEPARQFMSYVPHAPQTATEGRIVSVYGSNLVRFATQNQVVALNLGKDNGMEVGLVLAILKDGTIVKDRTDAKLADIKLPNERNGLLMVFRVFDKVSYALILQAYDGLQVGDRVTNPR